MCAQLVTIVSDATRANDNGGLAERGLWSWRATVVLILLWGASAASYSGETGTGAAAVQQNVIYQDVALPSEVHERSIRGNITDKSRGEK